MLVLAADRGASDHYGPVPHLRALPRGSRLPDVRCQGRGPQEHPSSLSRASETPLSTVSRGAITFIICGEPVRVRKDDVSRARRIRWPCRHTCCVPMVATRHVSLGTSRRGAGPADHRVATAPFHVKQVALRRGAITQGVRNVPSPRDHRPQPRIAERALRGSTASRHSARTALHRNRTSGIGSLFAAVGASAVTSLAVASWWIFRSGAQMAVLWWWVGWCLPPAGCRPLSGSRKSSHQVRGLPSSSHQPVSWPAVRSSRCPAGSARGRAGRSGGAHGAASSAAGALVVVSGWWLCLGPDLTPDLSRKRRERRHVRTGASRCHGPRHRCQAHGYTLAGCVEVLRDLG